MSGAVTALIASTARLTKPLFALLAGAFRFEPLTNARVAFFAEPSLELFFFAAFLTLPLLLVAFLADFFAPGFLAAFFAFLAITRSLYSTEI